LDNLAFLVSYPRSGNTLLASILNQNNKIACTGNSINFEVLHQLNMVKENKIYQNFADEQSYDNIIKNLFNNYYKNWNKEFIIERSLATTPDNIKYIDQDKYKYIFLKRDIFEILNSFVNLFKSNQDERSDFQICEEILERENILWRSILAYKNGIKCLDKSQYITLSYEDLLKNAPDQIKKIYDFLGIKYYEHHFTNLNQLCINNIRYNDKALPLRFQNLHKIRTDKIIKNKIKSDLPKELIDICNEFEKEIIV